MAYADIAENIKAALQDEELLRLRQSFVTPHRGRAILAFTLIGIIGRAVGALQIVGAFTFLYDLGLEELAYYTGPLTIIACLGCSLIAWIMADTDLASIAAGKTDLAGRRKIRISKTIILLEMGVYALAALAGVLWWVVHLFREVY